MKKQITKIIWIIFLTALSCVSCVNSNTKIDKLKTEIDSLVKSKNATVGVSIIANNFKDTININENLHYPMQSVFKFPIALAVLSEVDKGNLKLNQEIIIFSKDLLPDTWSPIREKFPDGTTMTVADIIKYTMAQSDNNGCDILLRLLGGTTAVEEFLSQHQITDISIKFNEEDMHKEWNIQFQNWATPIALTKLLAKFYVNDNILSKESYEFLWRVMSVETTTGTDRLKGQLPQGIIIAHKTGTSGTNEKNTTAAINDIGIIILPNGNPIFISVLVSNSTEDHGVNEKIISDIAKKVWDYYAK
nr:VEB-PER [uncultured bacterium]